MSFQRFRIQGMMPTELPASSIVSSEPRALQISPSNEAGPSSSARPGVSFRVQLASGEPKLPYGAGNLDDGYTLVFASFEAFSLWRTQEEEEKVVEFVKGDTHSSKAVPPRFKEHTKLVCARHNRSGRKKYVKKYPDRVRKVPSRKIEGEGCPASISYKTYHDSDEVRVCYQEDHSHAIGAANLPFTRKGRKIQAGHGKRGQEGDVDTDVPSVADVEVPTSSTSAPAFITQPTSFSVATAPTYTIREAVPLPRPPHPAHQSLQASIESSEERWDRMNILFSSVREHAREFQYPSESVSALESILIRMYLESPMDRAAARQVPTTDPALPTKANGI